jgi:hypothetical protein
VTSPIPIRHLVALRGNVTDRTLLDYLELRMLSRGNGIVGTNDLRSRWDCDQSTVSRRLSAVCEAGLADITPGWGAYHVHGFLELAA